MTSISTAAALDCGACAVLIAPERSSVTRNGTHLGTGLHLLRHADRIELGAQVCWVAVQPTPDETTYAPATHGPDLLCPRLKLRLREGERVVICCGPPSRPCELLYDARAWHAGVDCACGFDPAAAPWTPPSLVPSNKRMKLDELVASLGQRRV